MNVYKALLLKEKSRIENDFEETMANRRAGRELMEEQAFKGDKICALAMALDSIREVQVFGIITSVEYGDDDYDDIRPY